MAHRVLLLNTSFDVLSFIPWQRAATMIVTGTAYAFESHPTEVIRSPQLVIPRPVSIVLKNWVNVPWRGPSDTDAARRIAVLHRDGFTCGYCGEQGSTIDHILPQSRGGLSTWDNLITACAGCNQFKADRTPEEAGMTLLWPPKAPGDPYQRIQERIWVKVAELD